MHVRPALLSFAFAHFLYAPTVHVVSSRFRHSERLIFLAASHTSHPRTDPEYPRTHTPVTFAYFKLFRGIAQVERLARAAWELNGAFLETCAFFLTIGIVVYAVVYCLVLINQLINYFIYFFPRHSSIYCRAVESAVVDRKINMTSELIGQKSYACTFLGRFCMCVNEME